MWGSESHCQKRAEGKQIPRHCPWLYRENIHGSAEQLAGFEHGTKCRDIHDGATCRVDEDTAFFHLCELLFAHHVLGGRGFRNMQGDHICCVEQFLQGVYPFALPRGSFVMTS